MVREQASTTAPPPGRFVPDARRSVGQLHRVHSGTVAADADLQRDDAGAWLSAALALTARYRGQSLVGAIGAGGAVALLVAYIASAGPWG